MGTEKPKDPNDETSKVFDSKSKDIKTESPFTTNDHDYNGGREVPVVTQPIDNFDAKNVRVKTELNCAIADNVYESNFSPNDQKFVVTEGCSSCITKCENGVSSTMRSIKRKACYDIPIKQEEDAINNENDNIQNQPLPVDLDLIKVENGCSNSDCDSQSMQSQCIQTYECNKCSLVFTDKEIFTIHYKQCSTSEVPSNNVARCSVQQSHSSPNLKKLIESIREHPCIYNVSNKDYINIQLKNILWAEIATECNFLDVLSAKAAWKRLIESFHELLKHPRNAKLRPFKYQKQMEFLLPYINSAISSEHLNNESDEGIRVELDDVDADDVHMVQQLMSPAKKQKTVETLNTSLRNSREANTRRRSSSQPLDMFFMSMCETTKNLPSHLQILVKRRVFQAVIEAEEAAATHSANDQGTSNVQGEQYANVFSFRANSTAVVDNSSSSQED